MFVTCGHRWHIAPQSQSSFAFPSHLNVYASQTRVWWSGDQVPTLPMLVLFLSEYYIINENGLTRPIGSLSLSAYDDVQSM